MNRHCIDCEWVRGLGGAGQSGGLFCHRFPPILVSAREGVWSGWPEVRELDDCGEWAPTWKERLRELEASTGARSLMDERSERLRAMEASTGVRRLDEQEIKVLGESLAKDRLVRPDEEDKL